MVTEALLTSDIFDNIDARRMPDGLLDFAGETFNPLIDIADAPYGGYISAGNEKFLRETALRNTISAIAGQCYENPFSESPSVDKLRSKMLVFTSSLTSAFGYEDVCDMFSRAALIYRS